MSTRRRPTASESGPNSSSDGISTNAFVAKISVTSNGESVKTRS